MSAKVALLRAVNVAGHGVTPMARLVELFSSLGLADPVTLLASGNVVFADGGGAAALESRLQNEARATLGRDIVFMVRGRDDWQALIEANPFDAAARDDPGHLLAYVLNGIPNAEGEYRLKVAIKGPEQMRIVDRCLYAYYPDGVGRSKLTLALIEKSLGVSATGRNWNTVLKIDAALAGYGRR